VVSLAGRSGGAQRQSAGDRRIPIACCRGDVR
jgi:hypothetical protein